MNILPVDQIDDLVNLISEAVTVSKGPYVTHT